MNKEPKTPPVEPADPNQPVAYDQHGRPLYAHPPTQQNAPEGSGPQPHIVYMTRPAEPITQHISESARKRHEEAKKSFPGLNLSDGEYVISAVRRHPIGLLSIWFIVAFVAAITYIGGPWLLGGAFPDFLSSLNGDARANGTLFVVLLGVLYLLGGIVATVIYRGNQFYLTNESVIQIIQHDLLSQKHQTISLTNIEDASFRQHGILQTILNYGSLRLSTEGDETTYRFSFVANPKRQVDLLNNAVEAFKNGRPVDPNEEN